MNIFSSHLDALKAIGYTEEEARFLYIVATHSGYFVARQFLAFTEAHWGKRTTTFWDKLHTKKHARTECFPKSGVIYHLFSRKLYRQIGLSMILRIGCYTVFYAVQGHSVPCLFLVLFPDRWWKSDSMPHRFRTRRQLWAHSGLGSCFAWLKEDTRQKNIERKDGLSNNQAEYHAFLSALESLPENSALKFSPTRRSSPVSSTEPTKSRIQRLAFALTRR